ncbi:MAG: M56 family metallopeptidase [Balneolaceae bacterium]|nr:M56 family metallopeptidase [Balneolaceae bacterium]MDR9409305.1 M56 family metallopeptidase [Balneolaceae bacterium]
METFIQEIAFIGEQIVQFSWFPLLIWTIFSTFVWVVLRFAPAIHSQYQYHGRLALLFALPLGFVTLGFIEFATGLFFTSTSTSGLTLISVSAPFQLTVTAASANAVSTLEILYAVSFLFLLIGLILFVIRNSLQWFQLRQLQTNCEFSPIQIVSGLDNETHSLIQTTNRTVQITFLDKEVIPVTFGVRKPVIVLPDSIKKDSEKLNLVLQHELTHIIQKDFLSNIAIVLTQIVFWFHPLVHVLKRELIDYREIRCDSIVLSNPSISRKKYATLLLELLPMPNINKELSVNMAQESSNLKKRIQMITQQSTNRPIPKRSSAAIFAFIILCTAIAMSCTDMQTQGEEPSSASIQAESQEGDYYEVVEQMPELIGGLESLQDKISYPELAKKAGVQGRVYIRFIVNKNGNVENAEVIRGIGSGADEEALRVVSEAKFTPGMQDGNPVRVQYAIPVFFRLGTDSENSSSTSGKVHTTADEMPKLKGGLEQVMRNIRYPEMAKEAGIEGTVYIQFVVNENGNVEDATVIRGIGGGADEEALRVVREATFEPGYQDGKPIRVQYSIPIQFKLSQDTDQ